MPASSINEPVAIPQMEEVDALTLLDRPTHAV